MSGTSKTITLVNTDGLKTALSQVKTKVDSAIADAISESTTSLTSTINSGDTNTLNSAKSYADGLKTTIDSSIASNLASAKGYADGIKTAIEANLDTYGVSSMSFDSNTSVLTLTMKDTNTKTVTITGTSSGSSGENNSSTPTNLTLSDITDVTATSTEVNYLSGTTSNIQTQISNLLKSVFPVIERNKYYSKGTRVASPLTPYIYFEALTGGTSGSTNTVKSILKLTFDISNDLAFVESGTNRDLVTAGVSYFKPGSLFKDNKVIWLAQNLTDGTVPGEIIFKATSSGAASNGYLDLSSSSSTSLFRASTSSNNLNISFSGIRVAREYIDNQQWLNISSNQLSGFVTQGYINIANNATNGDKQLFKISLDVTNKAETNEAKAYIDDNSINSTNTKFLCYFAAIQILKKYINGFLNPSTALTTVTINSYEATYFNNATGLSYTATDYSNFTNAVINTINTTLPISQSAFTIDLSIGNLQNYFIKLNNTNHVGNLENAGLPNIIGDVTMNINPSQMVFMENTSGVFTTTNSETQNKTTKDSSNTMTSNKTLHFDASNSNSIYGNSTSVTPLNVALIPYMKL